jgi:hypothetical protein
MSPIAAASTEKMLDGRDVTISGNARAIGRSSVD